MVNTNFTETNTTLVNTNLSKLQLGSLVGGGSLVGSLFLGLALFLLLRRKCSKTVLRRKRTLRHVRRDERILKKAASGASQIRNIKKVNDYRDNELFGLKSTIAAGGARLEELLCRFREGRTAKLDKLGDLEMAAMEPLAPEQQPSQHVTDEFETVELSPGDPVVQPSELGVRHVDPQYEIQVLSEETVTVPPRTEHVRHLPRPGNGSSSSGRSNSNTLSKRKPSVNLCYNSN